MGYDTGLAALQQAINSSKSKGDGKLDYASWKKDETKVVRFLTDQVISAQFANWVIDPANPTKTNDFLIDPSKGNFVEKYGGKAKNRETGFFEDPKLDKKGVCIAVLRQESPDPVNPGRYVVSDVLQTINVDGQTYQGRVFIVIKQALRNFWNPLLGAAERYGTLIDRDWSIRRVGATTDTIYIPTALEPNGDPTLEALRDPNVLKQYYGYEVPWNEQDPNRFFYCPKTLVEWADWYSSEERAKKWLDKAPAAASGFAAPPVQGYPGLGFPAGGFGQQTTGAGIPGVSYGYPSQQTVMQPPPPQPQYPQPPQVVAVGQPPALPGFGEFAQQTTHNPPAVANAPLPTVGAPPPLPGVVQAPPAPPGVTIPVPPAKPVAQPPAPPWESNEDEAQAAPSANTDWHRLQQQLVPQLIEQPPTQSAPASQ